MKFSYNASKKWMTGLGMACVCSVLLSSCFKNDNNVYIPPAAYVSFIQASPDAPALDFYLNTSKVNSIPINFSNTVDYIKAYTGVRTANFYAAGTMNKIFSDTVQLNPNVGYSLFLVNTVAHPAVVLLTDSISKPATGNASIRFVNVSPDAPAVDLAIKDSTALISNKAFKGYSQFMPIKGSKTYTFEVRQHGTNTVLATLTGAQLNTGSIYTVWFRGLVNTTTDKQKLSVGLITNAYY
jgi:hypothetical protein